MPCGRLVGQTGGCPRNCRRIVRYRRGHWATGKARFRATTREPGNLPSPHDYPGLGGVPNGGCQVLNSPTHTEVRGPARPPFCPL